MGPALQAARFETLLATTVSARLREIHFRNPWRVGKYFERRVERPFDSLTTSYGNDRLAVCPFWILTSCSTPVVNFVTLSVYRLFSWRDVIDQARIRTSESRFDSSKSPRTLRNRTA